MRLKNFIVCDINEIKKSLVVASERGVIRLKKQTIFIATYINNIHTYIHIINKYIYTRHGCGRRSFFSSLYYFIHIVFCRFMYTWKKCIIYNIHLCMHYACIYCVYSCTTFDVYRFTNLNPRGKRAAVCLLFVGTISYKYICIIHYICVY